MVNRVQKSVTDPAFLGGEIPGGKRELPDTAVP